MIVLFRLHRSVLALALAASIGSAHAAPCAFEQQGEGRVVEATSGKSFRLADGREIRLAGIEPAGATKAELMAALSAIIQDKDVTLRGTVGSSIALRV